MLGISGDPDHRVRARPHQQVVDLSLVGARDLGDRLRQREDQVEIPHGQEFGLACRQPCLCRTRLALRAVPVTAGVVGDVVMPAVFASRDMAAERRRAATLDGAHDLQLIEADMAGISRPPGSPMGAEDIRNLQPCDRGKAAYVAPLLPFLRFAAVKSSSGLSTAEIMPWRRWHSALSW
jgi:hypothetical protein